MDGQGHGMDGETQQPSEGWRVPLVLNNQDFPVVVTR